MRYDIVAKKIPGTLKEFERQIHIFLTKLEQLEKGE